KLGGALFAARGAVFLPPSAVRLMPGSPWGTFTIAATIPIALLVGLYMYKIRPGKVVEASVIGGGLTIAATFIGGWVAHSSIGPWFNLSTQGVTIAMAIYGFVAAVLPVWVLLAPRDYLSSFLKIGTIALLVIGTIVANPVLHAPAVNHVFLKGGGPTVPGSLFPFLFITIMGGAVTLAVGMAHIFDEAARKVSAAGESAMQNLWKYWYHFAIMFEALFILTTIDAGTRIGRFLLQEAGGKLIHPKLAQPNWWPG